MFCGFVFPGINRIFRCLNFKRILCAIHFIFLISHQREIKPIGVAYQVHRINFMVGIGRQVVHFHNFSEVKMLKFEINNIRLPLQGYNDLLESGCSRHKFITCIVRKPEPVRQTSDGQYFITSEIKLVGQRHPVSTNQRSTPGTFGEEQFIIAVEHKYIHRFNLRIKCIRIFHIVVEYKFQPKFAPW